MKLKIESIFSGVFPKYVNVNYMPAQDVISQPIGSEVGSLGKKLAERSGRIKGREVDDCLYWLYRFILVWLYRLYRFILIVVCIRIW